MLLKYSRWRKINENFSEIQYYFLFDLDREKPIRYEEVDPSELVEKISALIKEKAPSIRFEKMIFGGITILNDTYENIEGEKEELDLDFTRDRVDFSRKEAQLNYSDLITRIILEMTQSTINKKPSKYEIIPKTEFENLTADEIKKTFVQRTKEIIEAETGYSLDLADLAEEIDALLIQKSIGSLFFSENETQKLIKRLVHYLNFQEIAKAIQNTPIQVEKINISQYSEELSEKTKKFMIDYSKLSDSEINEMREPIMEYLYFLGKTLRGRGGVLLQLGLTNAKAILDHLGKFPGLMEKLHSVG